MLYFVTYTTYSQPTSTVTAVVQQLVNWTVDVVVTYEPSKLNTRVRFPYRSSFIFFNFFFLVVITMVESIRTHNFVAILIIFFLYLIVVGLSVSK